MRSAAPSGSSASSFDAVTRYDETLSDTQAEEWIRGALIDEMQSSAHWPHRAA